jgi:signal transduction histidine kinase
MIQELERRQDELVESRKMAAIGTLTSGIAHELNNPLNNILLTAEAMKEELAKLNQGELAEMADDILSESERASEIVRDLLDFARSERPSLEEINVGELLQQTLRLVSNQAAVANIEVEVRIEEGIPSIYGERRSLQQVFLNLFVNAIQAMPNGGTLTVRAHKVPGTRDVAVVVSDTGVGIPSEYLSRIFDPFFTTKEVGRGTGLGLTVAYGIVEKHGGKIEVESQVGRGTTFTVVLPHQIGVGG